MIELEIHPAYEDQDGKGLITITMPAGGAGICYHILHSKNREIHADNWRISGAWIRQENSSEFCVTERGEWEMAVYLLRSKCFIGGILHGWEDFGTICILADGREISHLESLTIVASEITIRTEAKLLEPAEGNCPFAIHRKEYRFREHELVIRQTIEWLYRVETGRCYMAMFPIKKRCSDFLLPAGETVSIDLRKSGEIALSGISSVHTFTEDHRFEADFSISDCPEEWLINGTFLVTDNEGRDYHKMYFKVPVTAPPKVGDEWYCESHYFFQWKQ